MATNARPLLIRALQLVDLKAGDVIDKKYEVTASTPLGRGGMGVVYAARHRELGTHVALKFLLEPLVAKPDIASRFLHEARVGMRLKSLHVARIHDVSTHGDVPFIVMEHLEGVDLGGLLEEEGPLSLEKSADFLLQACEALHEAHTLGIVHRDLKPNNLFISNGPDQVKVLDLGISKSPYAEASVKTATHAVLGSPHYMAPEQITASRKVDARADIWSLGIILYQLLADTVPFPGKSIPDVHQAIRSRQWKKLAEHCENLPREVDDLVTRTLEPDREARPQTVLEFATALAPFGGPVAQEALARMRRVDAHNAGTPPQPIQPAGPDGAALNGTTIVDKLVPTPPPAPLKTPPAAAPPRPRWVFAAIGATVIGVPIGALVFVSRPAEPPAVTAPTPAPSASSRPPEPVASVASSVPPSLPSASAEVARPPAPAPPRAKPSCKGTASAECEEACKINVRDCEALAIALAHGRGAPQNTSRAAKLYEAACNAGSMSACSSAGALYADGDGVQRNEDRAIELYTQSCNGNYMIGCVNLGGIYYDDPGPRKDEKRGVELFRRACNAGEKEWGCRNLCIAYRQQRGVNPNERAPRVCEGKPPDG